MVIIWLMVLVKMLYYYTIQYNSYQYKKKLLAYTIPTVLPSGYSLPSGCTTSTIFGGNGFPTVSRTPFITVLGNNFCTFIGIPLDHIQFKEVEQILFLFFLQHRSLHLI
jgi:hypothetical protein